jgi:DtxR family Mn-dependent transcriptional regulator
MGKMSTGREELSASIEDYLEAIGHLERKNRVARVKDIAGRLNVQMPSVTGALKVLRDKGLVNYQRNSYITLTEEGLKVAKSVTNKHASLAAFLSEILLFAPEDAQEEACKIEHTVSDETVERLERLMDYCKEYVVEKKEGPRSWKKYILGGRQTLKSRPKAGAAK